ncbi:MAG: flippase [Candidatus Kapabacteria bacterium]|nr:flippase [Candidatus Kapabacteria bacterium]
MNQKRKLTSNFIALSIGEIASKGLNIAVFIYLARILDPDGFGMISFANSTTLIYAVFVNLGFDIIGMRTISKDPNQINKYVNNSITLKLLISVLLFMILILHVSLVHLTMQQKVLILISGLNFFSITFTLNWVFQAYERMWLIAFRQFLAGIITLIGALVLVHGKDDIVAAMSITLIVNVIIAVWLIVVYKKNYGPIKFELDYELGKSLLKSGIAFGLMNLMITFYNSATIQIIGYMTSEWETGIFSAALRFYAFMVLPSTIAQGVFFPRISKANTPESRDSIMKQFSFFSMLLGCFIGVFFFVYADNFTIILGPKFNGTSGLLKFMSISTILVYMTVTYNSALLSWGYEKKVVKWIFLSALTSISINILLIPHYGIYISAVTTIISEIIAVSGILFLYSKTKQKIYFSDLFKFLFLSVVSVFISKIAWDLGLQINLAECLAVFIYIALLFIFKIIKISYIKEILTNEV